MGENSKEWTHLCKCQTKPCCPMDIKHGEVCNQAPSVLMTELSLSILLSLTGASPLLTGPGMGTVPMCQLSQPSNVPREALAPGKHLTSLSSLLRPKPIKITVQFTFHLQMKLDSITVPLCCCTVLITPVCLNYEFS